jgi:eukaryotic-like serine/threonine-protein kinase
MATPSQLVGQTLGHYRILEQIGAGSFGEVYRAHDEQLERDVAVKVLSARALANPASRSRFRKEALVLAKLDHPNIATVYEFGSQDSVDFLVTAYITGITLDAKLALGALPPAEVLSLGSQLAQGLAAAHAKGIIHRDLKPGNLRLTPDARLKILDFGLAQLLLPEGDINRTETVTGSQEVTGTLPYMAPEQLCGQRPDARTDVWAAGAVLYEMATGCRPFPEKQGALLIDAILNKAPQPPSALNSAVSPALERVILKTLEKDPNRRYQTARDFGADLQSLIAGTPAVEMQGRRGWVPGVGIALVLLLVIGAWFGLNRRKTFSERSTVAVKSRRSVAVLGFKNLSGRSEASWLSTAFSEMLTTELAGGEKLRTIPGENVARMKNDLSLSDTDDLARDTLARIRRNLGSDFVVLGSYVDLGNESGGQIRLDLRVQDAAEGETVAYFSETGTEAQLLDLISRSGAELRAKLGVGGAPATEAAGITAALPSNSEAARLYAQGIAKLRVFDALGARDLLEKAVAADPNNPLVRSALAAAWSSLGYDEKAKVEAKRAVGLSSSLSREERLSVEARYHETAKEWDLAIEAYRTLFGFFPDNIDYGLRLADVETSAGKAEDALATAAALRRLAPPDRDDPRIDEAEAEADAFGNYKQGLSDAVRAVEKGKVEGARLLAARALSTQASLLYKLGDSQRSVAVAEESKRIYGEAGDQVGVARQLLVIGRVLTDRGEFSQATNTFDQALPIFGATGNKKGMASTWNDKAVVLFQRGDFVGAKKLYEQALAIYSEIGDRSGQGSALGNLGNTLSQLGDLAGARRMYEQALAIHREVGKQSSVALWLTNVGLVLSDQGDLAGAKKAFEESLEVSRRIGDKSFTAYALYGLGAALTMQADFQNAKRAYSEALTLRNEIGETGNAAAAQVALAELSLEEGHPTEAETTIRDAREVFRKTAQVEDEINADTLLLRTLLAKGEIAEALHEMDGAKELVKRDHDRGVRLDFAIAAARVLADSGDLAKARNELEATLAETAKYGYMADRLEARLALGEVEMKSGHTAAVRARLTVLEKDARAKGFLLVARKAAAAAKSSGG